jgi:hypothetical protein
MRTVGDHFRLKGFNDKNEVGNVLIRSLWFFASNGVLLRWRIVMFSLHFPCLVKDLI